MCPACLTTAALAVAGFASASGLTALTVKVLRARASATAASEPARGDASSHGR